MGLTLREVRDEDLPLLFEQWADPVAAHMAAFTAPDHMDRDAFERRWSRLRVDATVLARVIVVDDDVAGAIGSWGDSGEREVTYWIGRSYPGAPGWEEVAGHAWRGLSSTPPRPSRAH